MKPRTVRLLFMLTALVVLVGESRARGEFVDFSYSWSVQPSAVIPGGTGSVTLALAADGSSSVELGSLTPTPIPGATVTTTSSASDPPDSFNTNFSMKLHLTDTDSGASGDLTFAGTISGSLTATSSSLTSTFQNPMTQMLTLGNHVYSVTIDPTLINLPSPGSSAPALIDALVTASTKPTPLPQAPEPTSLVLGATAILGLAARRLLAARRRV